MSRDEMGERKMMMTKGMIAAAVIITTMGRMGRGLTRTRTRLRRQRGPRRRHGTKGGSVFAGTQTVAVAMRYQQH
jgi:hypothetical protein